MPKYIDADEIIKAVEGDKLLTERVKFHVRTTVKTVPAADVAPVRHGRWLDYDDTERFTARCSLCNNVIDTRFGKHFCPNCGADCRGGQDE